MARNLEEIKQEYANLCVKVGNTNYQIHALTKDLELLYQTMRDLNLEATKVQQEPVKAAEPELKLVTTEGAPSA